MGLFTFKGGIHPYEGKDLSKDKPVRECLPKKDMIYPLGQHIGAMAVPVVKKGDKVLAGQVIAKAEGFVSSNIHTSVSGTVKAIEPRMTQGGTKVNSIVIENNNKYETVDYSENIVSEDNMDREHIINAIKEAGIVGMGGAGFPTHVKLSPKNIDNIDYIIINGAECEPYLTSDYRRMIDSPEKLVEGLKIILKLFENATGIFAIEDNKPDAIKKLTELTKDIDNIIVNKVKTKYPQGAERQLIYANTKRYINSKMLPADAGCIVHNIDTIYAISEAVLEGKPLIDRLITVTGDAVNDPCNISVKLGTDISELIEIAGGFSVEQPKKIISGGPMMGKAMFTLDVPAVKGTSAILCFKEDEVTKVSTSNCIRCGKCSQVCPSQVLPVKLAELAEHGRIDEFIQCDGMECCECGCCSYVCPAKKHLTQTIAGTRKQILTNKKK